MTLEATRRQNVAHATSDVVADVSDNLFTVVITDLVTDAATSPTPASTTILHHVPTPT